MEDLKWKSDSISSDWTALLPGKIYADSSEGEEWDLNEKLLQTEICL